MTSGSPAPRGSASALAGTAVFVVVVPGAVAVLVPWLLTGWQQGDPPWWWVVRIVGAGVTLAGAAFLLGSVRRFAVEGRGTPAPVAPPNRLVVTGAYTWVRNPMYLAVTGAIAGQGMWLSRPFLLAYGLAVWAAMAAFVRWYEEPHLAGRFGQSYAEYAAAVPRWVPRRPATRPRP